MLVGVTDVGYLCLNLIKHKLKIASVHGAFEVSWLIELEERLAEKVEGFTYGDGMYSLRCSYMEDELGKRWITEVVGFTSIGSLLEHGSVGEVEDISDFVN